MNKNKNKTPKPTGPEPDMLKIEGDWQDAVGKALNKKRPQEGWPTPADDKGKDTE